MYAFTGVGKRKNAMRMAPTGLHFQRPGSLNPVTYLSGQINEPHRDCTEKAINQFVLLLDRLQLPAMHRRRGGGGSRFVSPAVFQPRFDSWLAGSKYKGCLAWESRAPTIISPFHGDQHVLPSSSAFCLRVPTLLIGRRCSRSRSQRGNSAPFPRYSCFPFSNYRVLMLADATNLSAPGSTCIASAIVIIIR
ncbi:hypothetical protein ALC53_06314 [Atta colombica]|uniref:Uncharacterized protein n=1 Tax=Atta colombica TaxID=520822 RepID=A0A195BFR4_9HYME|nr:hypothetical protein ALC53_06314 [Atta colombica]